MKNLIPSVRRASWGSIVLLATLAATSLLGCNGRRGWKTASTESARAVYPMTTISNARTIPSAQDPSYPELPPPEALKSHPDGTMRSVPYQPSTVRDDQKRPRDPASADMLSKEGLGKDDVALLQPPPDDEKKETLRKGSDEQPLEAAKANAIPDQPRPSNDASSAEGPGVPRTEAKPPRVVDGSYRLAVGDDLDLVFVESWAKGTEYRLLPGDQIRVEFVLRADAAGTSKSPLDRTVRLQPDGMISLPYVGVVSAVGTTIRELSQQLTGLYQDLYVNPNILVSLVTTGGGLEELQRALASAGGRTTRIAPDGAIMVPFLGAVKAENLDIGELEDELNERFRRAAPGFGVMVRLAGRP
ncbi:polysaccharide biosynthesis/export family protein [bacterium]|nr:polysaccharide biosynthesis/export family protein [bacterium]